LLEELSILIKLQEIDNQLMELDADKGDLPEQLAKLEDEISGLKSALEEIEKQLEDCLNLRTTRNSEIEKARDQLKRSQSVIYSVKTTREYDAISSEIEQAKNQITNGERQIIELMEREENLQNEMQAKSSELERIKSEHTERKAEMRERLGTNQGLERSLRLERKGLVDRLKKPVFAHYDRIRKIRDGIGVSYIVDNACSYCFSRLPPQRQAEVRRMNDLILCEVCGCIIVGEEESVGLQVK